MNILKNWFGRSPVLLVIEDSDEIAELLTIFLKARGFSMRRAKDGLEGLEEISKNPPDLVLLDITMPKMDGFEVLLKIKSDPKTKEIPVLMCTTHNVLQDVERTSNWGADGYVIKPFDLERVLEKIQAVLEKKRTGPS